MYRPNNRTSVLIFSVIEMWRKCGEEIVVDKSGQGAYYINCQRGQGKGPSPTRY